MIPKTDCRCYSLLVLIVLCGSSGSLAAQITWHSSKSHDFGKIKLSEERSTVFTFLNSSTKPLVIDNVRTTCGCAAPEWKSSPVLPGDTGEIRIELRPNRKGIIEKHIKVWFKEIKKPEKLKIEAEVY